MLGLGRPSAPSIRQIQSNLVNWKTSGLEILFELSVVGIIMGESFQDYS